MEIHPVGTELFHAD